MYLLRSWPDWSRLALFQCLAYGGCLGIISSHPLYFPGLYRTQTRGMQRKSKSLKNAISFGTKAKPSSTLAKWSYQDLQEIFSNISNLGEDIPLRKIIYYIQNTYIFPSGTREGHDQNLSYCYWEYYNTDANFTPLFISINLNRNKQVVLFILKQVYWRSISSYCWKYFGFHKGTFVTLLLCPPLHCYNSEFVTFQPGSLD